jgi:hypothetical protein
MRARILPAAYLLFILLIGAACSLPARLWSLTQPTAAPPSESDIPPALSTRQPFSPTDTASAPGRPAFSCTFEPALAAMMSESSPEQWIDWIEKLSGEQTVELNGRQVRIETRYSPAMFNGQPNALAFEWVKQQIGEWYTEDQIEEQPYFVEQEDRTLTWKNLVLTLPGTSHPDEIVILSAHLDSTSENPLSSAPGAEDNGSGAAALLEAARLFRLLSFERTVQIIWFTGEEQGLLGSTAFTQDMDPDRIAAVVNLDMFGFDSDNDRCFELHVGTLPASNAIGQCFVQTIEEYQLDLTYDCLTETATDRSDHGSFWRYDVGAIEVLQDLFENRLEDGCPARDPNPTYHTQQDVVENINPETGFLIVRAALKTAAAMAVPVETGR